MVQATIRKSLSTDRLFSHIREKKNMRETAKTIAMLAASIFSMASCHRDPADKKAYQIVKANGREYKTTFYDVDHGTGCISFVAYSGEDSSYVKECGQWDAIPNPDYSPE